MGTSLKTSNNKLNILHTESSCGWGGQEIRILNESQGLIAQGHNVSILCVPDSPIFQAAQQRNIPVVGLPIAKKGLRSLFAVLHYLRTTSFSVVNTHSSTDSWLIGLARSLLRHPPVVVRTRHISAPIRSSLSSRWLYTRGCDFVVTTGEKLRLHVVEQTGVSPEKVKSVPTGVDSTLFKPGDQQANRTSLNLPQDKIIIGIVATLRSWKGHVYLIEALAKLQREDVMLLIVGEGPNLVNINQAISQFNMQDKVIFAGQQANVVPWMQSMDIFVLPSYANEGVPQGLMQAMACGLPVISTPVGSITELITHEQNGMIVPAKDANALTKALQNLIDDRDKRQSLATHARDFVLKHHSSIQMLAAMSAIFASVVGR